MAINTTHYVTGITRLYTTDNFISVTSHNACAYNWSVVKYGATCSSQTMNHDLVFNDTVNSYIIYLIFTDYATRYSGYCPEDPTLEIESSNYVGALNFYYFNGFLECCHHHVLFMQYVMSLRHFLESLLSRKCIDAAEGSCGGTTNVNNDAVQRNTREIFYLCIHTHVRLHDVILNVSILQNSAYQYTVNIYYLIKLFIYVICNCCSPILTSRQKFIK